MSTTHAALALWTEATAVALVFAALGATARRGLVLAAALAAHAVLGVVAWKAAGGSGDAGVLLRVRALFAAEALVAWGTAAALGRAGVERGVAAAIAATAVIALAVAPAPGEALAQGSGGGAAAVRSISYAVSPPFAASHVLGLDLLHGRTMYGRAPAAVMEMHMTSWIWTAGMMFAVGGGLAGLALLGRRRKRVALVALVALVAAAGCKKKDEAAKPPDKVKTGSGTGTGSGTAAGTGSGTAAGTGSGTATGTGSGTAAPTGVTADEVKAAIARGIDYLAGSRSADGLIGNHPGTTALAVLAMVSAEGGPGADDPKAKPSLDALVALAKPDGSIVDKDFPVYVTAISVLAFEQAKVHPDLVEKGQAWLAGKQFGATSGVEESDVNYGGFGYGIATPDDKDADLSNAHFALEALKDSTLKDRAEVLARAQKFLERCQNRTETNDQKWATDDGGFVYKPGDSKAGGTASTASMTYAGVAAFLYTDVPAGDPRVTAALDWLRDHFSVDENPGLGTKGLYYHYHMMARALALVGQRDVVGEDGVHHDWPTELAGKLVKEQKADGSWANADATYWENNPGIATARALLALEYALASMK